MTRPEIHNEGRAYFAEYAEAMGVRTDQIAVVRTDGKDIIIVYHTNPDLDDRDAIAALCRRDDDGLLEKIREIVLPGFYDRMVEAMDELDFEEE